MASVFWRILSLLCLACLANPGQAQENAAPIRDDAGMFHEDAVRRAEQGIAQIQQEFDRGLFVRTIASAPSRSPRWLPIPRTARISRSLEEQARKFADEFGTPGIYVLVCNRPLDVHVIVRPDGDVLLNRHDAENLRQNLTRNLHDKGGDAALLAFVDFAHDILQDHAARGSSPLVKGIVLVGLLGCGLILWLLLRLIRGRILAKSSSEGGTPARQTPALLGAMFCFPAGQWIYDKMYLIQSPSDKTGASDAS